MSQRPYGPRPHGGRGHGGGPMGPPMMHGAEKARDFKGTLRRLLRYVSRYWGAMAFVVVTSVAATILSTYATRVTGRFTDELIGGLTLRLSGTGAVNFGRLGQILALLGGLYLMNAGLQYIQERIMVRVSQKTVYSMRRDIDEKLARLPLKYHDGRTHGEILSRMTNDVDTVSSSLQRSIVQIISSIVTIISVLYFMLSISPFMTLIILAMLPVTVIFVALLSKRSQKQFKTQMKTLGELNGHIEEAYSGHRILKAFGRERAAQDEFSAINGDLYASGWKAQFLSGLLMPVLFFINNISYVLVCIIGGIRITRGQISIGDIQSFIQYARQFSQPITQTANIANIIQSTVAAAERVFEVLDEPEETPDPAYPVMLSDAGTGRVAFEHVRFSYQESDSLIQDLSFTAEPGRVIAIVGPTGGGKTTLVNLLMRFYDIQDGRITIDGVETRAMRRDDLRRLMGMVLQDTWLFEGTIRDNIAYGREGATQEDIVAAAEHARADAFIRTLPEGYDTILTESAGNLSQGQKQLLTIARALLSNPAILILDEATSSVDTRTEFLIQKAMAQLMRGRTSFVIAHRLSTIRDADLILVIHHGDVVEQGTHADLLARGGFYAELYNSQFA